MPGGKQPRDEFSLIARYLKELDRGPAVVVGNGDDGAVLRLDAHEELVVSVDSMLEGVHFPFDSPPSELAYRAVAAATSDLAAMGARPLGMTLALTIPEADDAWLRELRLGLSDAVGDFSLPLVGGDLTRGSLTLSVQVMGAVPAGGAIRRDGARPGDRVCVSGPLGDAAAGLALIEGRVAGDGPANTALREHFWRPMPALDLGISLRGKATAAVDVSDGLLADLGHIAEASKVCVIVDSSQLPISEAVNSIASGEQALAWALGGGEDYCLGFTLPESHELPPGSCVIGRVEEGAGVRCDAADAVDGYRHF
ncbi:thiamine-phosphate kinase [Congregibacter litoralis]|uniref:Thiamine-monophosphate kinase n=1 Tax=Congregibacter litoralis KT71 TaxID=314285 RepID=A4A6E1_9GAMM|nr:thiamine-phosphate kinase [Congregibacter litoralis]EAQ98588.1 thiamine-phosphate kinase [Congregibacter litoralis KT71]